MNLSSRPGESPHVPATCHAAQCMTPSSNSLRCRELPTALCTLCGGCLLLLLILDQLIQGLGLR